jgi:2-polyprenyl-6-hydroxyphenyl methylase / 3-demethylubiquinone-9 3-methyltransferase
MEDLMAEANIDNSIYDKYGDRWYTAYDDPIALLRAESKIKTPWIYERILNLASKDVKVLDVGCGAGFLANDLARKGLSVTGVDLSPESVKVAAAHDETNSVRYEVADAARLPYPDQSFDVVTAMDFLEHVEDPAAIIKEMGRVLKPGGLFFYHTFNRNFLCWLVVIKMVEWIVKNTPKHMHVLRLFIKPSELEAYCQNSGMRTIDITGLRPVFSTIPISSLFTGVVPESMRFTLTRNLWLSYLGVARKQTPLVGPESPQ